MEKCNDVFASHLCSVTNESLIESKRQFHTLNRYLHRYEDTSTDLLVELRLRFPTFSIQSPPKLPIQEDIASSMVVLRTTILSDFFFGKLTEFG